MEDEFVVRGGTHRAIPTWVSQFIQLTRFFLFVLIFFSHHFPFCTSFSLFHCIFGFWWSMDLPHVLESVRATLAQYTIVTRVSYSRRFHM